MTETATPNVTSTAVADPADVRPRLALARLRDLALIPPIIAIVIIGYFVNHNFLTSASLTDVLGTMAPIAMLVLAETLVLLTGRMDLSIESTFGLAPGVAAWLTLPKGIEHGTALLPGMWAVPIALAVGLLIGLVNGLLVVRLGLNAFILTLGGLIALRGLLTGISHGQTFFGLSSSQMYLGSSTWLGVPVSVWLVAACFGLGIFVLSRMRWGRSLYAIGGNSDAARAAGIRTDRTVWSVFILASGIAALGGVIQSGHLASVTSQQGNGAIFQVFAAAVIGGVSLNGGKGSLFGAFTGVLLLFLIQKVLTFAGVSGEWFDFLNGLIIVVVLILQRAVSGRKAA